MQWTRNEIVSLHQLLSIKLSGYTGGRADELTITAFQARLEEFAPKVAMQAVGLLDLYARSRLPMAGDAFNLAESIEKHGYRAASLAAREWPKSLEYEPPAPTPKQWHNAVLLAKRRTGNPDRDVQVAAELPENAATPTESAQAFERHVRERMAKEGCTDLQARIGLVQDALGGFGARPPEKSQPDAREKAS